MKYDSSQHHRRSIRLKGYDYKPMTLGDVVHRFKSLTTAKYRHGVTQLG